MYYMYISSSDSLRFHPQNKPSHFVIELPRAYENFKRAALLEFSCENLFEPVFVLCDILERSLAHDQERAVLNYVSSTGSIQNPLFVNTLRDTFSRVIFKIVTKEFTEPNDLGYVHMIIALED